ncbi:MAG: universal stress protein [Pseudomonadaceae bacterium]
MSEARVLACIDGSAASEAVCDCAAWASLRLGAPLALLHVLEPAAGAAPTDLSGSIGLGSREHLLSELAELDERRARLLREQGKLMLDAAAARVRADGVAEPTLRQRHGGLVDTLHELEGEVRLLVMGRQGEAGGSAASQVGSQLESVIRTLHRPVLITTGEYRAPQRVLIAFDNSPSVRKGLDLLMQSPLLADASIHLLLVGADTADTRQVMEAARKRLEEEGFAATAEIRAGDVEETLLLCRREREMDLIVMGAYGHSRIRQFFVGSTTTSMLRRTDCPLLLLR